MKTPVYILVILILFSCENTSEKKTNHSSDIQNAPLQKDSIQNKEIGDKTVNLSIPDEIKNKIDETVVFAIADIGTWDGDYIGNTLYVLYKTGNIKRISNNKLPETGKLFCYELTDYHKTDSLKYDTFFNYLQKLTELRYNNEFKTPDDLDVSGGSIHYVYINAQEPGFWISFEPESSDLTEKVEKEFDRLFIN